MPRGSGLLAVVVSCVLKRHKQTNARTRYNQRHEPVLSSLNKYRSLQNALLCMHPLPLGLIEVY